MKLKKDLEKSVYAIIKAFEKKQELNFEFFVCDDVTNIASFGCVFYFNISDICYDLFTEQPKGQILDWLYDCIDNEKQTINYQSYSKGLRFEAIKNKKEIIIIDIDGTVSKVGDRLKYLLQSPKNWDAFYASCFKDEPINEVIEMLIQLESKYKFVFCTGRRESIRNETEKWLNDHMLFGDLLMRPNNDFRDDTEVKPEQLQLAGINLKDIAFVLEDRNSMVNKWRSLGLKCLQVEEGDF